MQVKRIWVIAPAGKTCPIENGRTVDSSAAIQVDQTIYINRRLLEGALFQTNAPAAPAPAPAG